ncbi:uncharacterized protein BDW47DRAFT_127480 [Aspergillus candidus]|uniref:Uncharacterized protein n=1 Tax=Aspergillus candidus TaxID=41067 RepID=A0A2I2F670_ASPCN|nr:hypothetical protein BDW47DRAFT_127480 [Aspergillus candidus]PLB36127.1 hypothetical protein BDW47DRAFT_127480 [Aspergillus candidus]
MHLKIILSLLPLLPLTSAICPGYNYAFFNGGDNWFYTADVACKIRVTGRCDNICECRHWGCSPAHSVNRVRVNGLWYSCRGDRNKGTCGASKNQIQHRAPESCCRNDGRRNFEEGLISRRHADAITVTNELLERHAREFDHAEKRGIDLGKLRRRQLNEVDHFMKREAEAAAFGDE